MQNRRNFLKTIGFAAAGTGLLLSGKGHATALKNTAAYLKHGKDAKMKMRFYPYELELKLFTMLL